MNFSIYNVRKEYHRGKTALADINAELSAPAFIGLLGPNGAGKSTLMKLLTLGLLPTEGEILLDGAPLQKQEAALHKKLGYLPQEYGLYEELTVWQFLDYMAALKELGKTANSSMERVLALCGLEERRNSRISALSGGFKQRVGIAQALLGTPDLLILDEPTVGLDPEERIRIRNLFVEEARDKILILSTHIIEDVQSVCNRLIVLHEGSIRYDGPPEGLVALSAGHVGTYTCAMGEADQMDGCTGCKVTSKVVAPEKTTYRLVAEHLPTFAQQAAPNLEDAYIYAMTREEVAP